MIKTAVVELGKTPSSVSGKKSTEFDDSGEPIADCSEKQACDIQTLPKEQESEVQ